MLWRLHASPFTWYANCRGVTRTSSKECQHARHRQVREFSFDAHYFMDKLKFQIIIRVRIGRAALLLPGGV